MENGNGPEEHDIADIGGLRGLLATMAALHTVGGPRLVMAVLVRRTWATLGGWFGKG